MIRPLVVSFIGPRPTLIFGGIFYVLFIAQIMYPMNILLYMGSALLGFGGAMMWVAQGHFLTINSRSGSCTSELQLKVNCRLGWSASQLFARAGSGHFLFWPGSAWAFWPWASSGYRFWHMLGQFLPIFQLRGQFLRFGLGRATQNLAQIFFLQYTFSLCNSLVHDPTPSPETMERNSGFFFAIFQSSQVWGNTYVYFEFQDLVDIDRDTRITVMTI